MIVERTTALLLGVAALVTALTVVHTKHLSRVDFNRLQTLLGERDAMDIEWGRLQIEQSTLAQHARVEEIAYRKLGMVPPDRPRLLYLER